MQACQVLKFKKNTLDNLTIGAAPIPAVGPTQALVKMQRAALNPADLYIASGEALSRAVAAAERIGFQPRIDKIFPLAEAKEALVYLRDNAPKGKVILEIGG